MVQVHNISSVISSSVLHEQVQAMCMILVSDQSFIFIYTCTHILVKGLRLSWAIVENCLQRFHDLYVPVHICVSCMEQDIEGKWMN